MKLTIMDNYDPILKNSEKEKDIKKVLILGSTGTGKSALCNSLICEEERMKKLFIESEKFDSCTPYANPQKVTWFDNQGQFRLIDTPGFNDSYENDNEHISKLVDVLKDSEITLNTFIIVLNGANPRLDEPMKAMLKMFAEMFTLDFLYHTIIVFTRWPFEEKDIIRRKKNNEDEESRTKEINQKLNNLLKFDTESYPIPCYFLCNSYNNKEIFEDSSEDAKKKYIKSLSKIKKYVLKSQIYYCNKIKKVETEKEQLKKKLEEQEKKNLMHKIARGGCKRCDCLEYAFSYNKVKKEGTAVVAGATGTGGLAGGVGGATGGLILGSLYSGYRFFTSTTCNCEHEKNDHYDPKKDNVDTYYSSIKKNGIETTFELLGYK